MAKVLPKSGFWMHAFDWPEQTLKFYLQYSTYFACNNDLRSAMLTNLLGDIFLSFLPHWALKKAFKKSKKCQRSPKIWVFDACINIWLARTNRQNWVEYFACKNESLVYAELCCQIVWEHFPQLCVKFQPCWKQLVSMFMTTQYF